MPRANPALAHMPLHLDQLDAGKRVVHEGEVLIVEFSTMHDGGLWGWGKVPARDTRVPGPDRLIYERGDDLREGVSSSVEPRFDRAEVAVRNLGDLLV